MAVTSDDAIEERRREIQSRRKAQKAKRRKAALKRFLIFLCVLAVITLAVLSLTVFFSIEKITVNSTSSVYTSDQIIKASGIKKGENLWMSGLSAEEDIPVKLPFIAQAEVIRKFPSSVIIKTEPAKAVYTFKLKNDYYVCDFEYKVLEVNNEVNNDSLILIYGAEFDKAKAGNKLSFSNDKKQQILMKVFELLNGKKVKINSVDVSEVMEITVRVEDRFNVYLGSSAHIDLKISHLAGMLKEVDADTIGSIDLSEYTPENGRGILTRE